MKEVEKNLDAKINQFEQKIDGILPKFATHLAQINEKSMQVVIEKAQTQLEISQLKVNEIAKINSYKPILVIAMFCLLIVIASSIAIKWLYNDIESQKQALNNQLSMMQQHGKDITLSMCDFKGSHQLCIKVVNGASSLKDDKGNTYALVKK